MALWHFLKVSQRPHRRGELRSTIRAVKNGTSWKRSLLIASLWFVSAQLAVNAVGFQGSKNARGPIPSVGRRQLWAMRIAQLVKEPPGWTETGDHEISSLAFSPDDQQLALTITHVEFPPAGRWQFQTHLLITDVRSPERSIRQFDLREPCGGDLAWNEGGNALVICGHSVLRLGDGTICNAGGQIHWLNSTQVIRSNTGEILTLGCEPVGTWPLEATWEIGEIAASEGWILLWHTKGQRPDIVSEFSIVEYASRQAPPGWRGRNQEFGSPPTFAEGADAVCSSVTISGGPHCWAIRGGKEIPVPKQARGYSISRSSASSPRVLAEKWDYERDPWWDWLLTRLLFWWVPEDWDPPRIGQRQVVFDLRSGKWLSSWGTRISNPIRPFHPHHYALSANGELLAESGDGGLELYRLAP
jgi:hypothetical protein